MRRFKRSKRGATNAARTLCWTVAACVFVVGIAAAARGSTPHAGASRSRHKRIVTRTAPASASGGTAFVVRTCAGQQDADQVFHLGVMLDSLQNQTDPNWTALLVNTDVVAMKPLAKRHDTDPRIRMANVTVTTKYDEWNAAYPATDAAIRGLHTSSHRWFIVTNGDNVYAPDFLEAAQTDTDGADVVTVDFYGRFTQQGSGVDPIDFGPDTCLASKLERGYIDLGGALLSLPKYVAENRRFMDYGPINAQDGLTFADLAASGWRAKRVPRCLFAHSPNPYTCAQLGGVWFRSVASRHELGDACWTKARLQAELAKRPDIIQAVSSSGVPYAMLNDHDHEQAAKQFDSDQAWFMQEYMAKLRLIRRPYCKRLRAMGYALDTAWYAANNDDLVKLSPDELRAHFWANGCIEARPLPRYPRGYFKPLLVSAPLGAPVLQSRADTLVVYIFSDTGTDQKKETPG